MTDPTPEQAQALIEAARLRMSQAETARAAGVTLATMREWLSRGKDAPDSPCGALAAAMVRARSETDQLPRGDYLRMMLRQVHEDIEAARKAKSLTAVSTLTRQALDLRRDLDALTEQQQAAAAGDEFEDMDDEALLAALTDSIAQLPDHLADGLLELLVERIGSGRVHELIGPPPLRVMRGGEE